MSGGEAGRNATPTGGGSGPAGVRGAACGVRAWDLGRRRRTALTRARTYWSRSRGQTAPWYEVGIRTREVTTACVSPPFPLPPCPPLSRLGGGCAPRGRKRRTRTGPRWWRQAQLLAGSSKEAIALSTPARRRRRRPRIEAPPPPPALERARTAGCEANRSLPLFPPLDTALSERCTPPALQSVEKDRKGTRICTHTFLRMRLHVDCESSCANMLRMAIRAPGTTCTAALT